MCNALTPLHLKIKAWHKKYPEPGMPTMDKFRMICSPRQNFLNTLDPDHTRPVEELRAILRGMKDDYMDLLDNVHDVESLWIHCGNGNQASSGRVREISPSYQ